MNPSIRWGSRWLFLSVIVGVISGAATSLFVLLLHLAHTLFIVKGIGLWVGKEGSWDLPWFHPLLFLVIPTLGGLLCGLLISWFAPEAEGHGTDSVLKSFHRERSIVKPRAVLVKMFASALTIGSGGSAGPEGPMAQIGSGIGSIISRIFRLSRKERNILFIAGIAGGIGSIFRAPLGGAIFAPEILYSQPDFETDALAPSLISSITAYTVYCAISGDWNPIFDVPAITFRHPLEIILYIILGLLMVVGGRIYIQVFYFFHNRIFGPLKIPLYLKPALGGLGLGAIAYFFPVVMGSGYPLIQNAIYGGVGIGMLLGLAGLKILATSFTIGSRGSGGVFAPTVVIGGLLGGAFGLACQDLFPNFVAHPSSYILVGMGGFLAGVAKVPIAALIMVAEMSHSYDLLVPIICTATVAYLLSGSHSIFSQQVPSRVDSPAHLGDFSIDILSRIKVSEVLKRREILTFREDTPFEQVVNRVTDSDQITFPVVDRDGRMLSLFTLEDVKSILPDRDVWEILVARDLGTDTVFFLFPDDTLETALKRFTASRMERLPVLDPDEQNKLTGMVSRHDILSAYHAAMKSIKEEG